MKFLTQTIITALLATGFMHSPTVLADKMSFGQGADMTKLKAIDAILAAPQQFVDKQVTVKGEIKAVCKKRGCWMELAANNTKQVLKIKVKDGDMVFPVSKKGQTAYATGVLKGKQLNKQQTIAYYQHLAEEQKQSFDSATITEGMMLYQLAATGVSID